MQSGSSIGDITFLVDGEKSGSFTLEQQHCDGSLGFQISAKTADKDAFCAGEPSEVLNIEPDFLNMDNGCGIPSEGYEKEQDLVRLGSLHLLNDWPKVCSDHDSTVKFDAPAPIYVIDVEKELGEAVGGALGAFMFFVMAGGFCLGGLICATAPCCCCRLKEGEGAPAK